MKLSYVFAFVGLATTGAIAAPFEPAEDSSHISALYCTVTGPSSFQIFELNNPIAKFDIKNGRHSRAQGWDPAIIIGDKENRAYNFFADPMKRECTITAKVRKIFPVVREKNEVEAVIPMKPALP